MRISNTRPPYLVLLGAMLLSSGCSLAEDRPAVASAHDSAATASVKSVTINLPKQALFSVIAPDTKATDEATQAYQIFRSRALSLAAEYGFTLHGSFALNGAAIGSFEPQGFLLTSWPSQEAFDSFQHDPRWAEFDALRPTIWNDIRYYRDVQEDGLSLTLKSNKFYTLAIAHTNPANPGDYDQYLSNLKDEVEKNGGRFILKLSDPSLESLSGATPPNQLTFIEWDDAEGVDRLLGSDVYKATRHLAASGTTELSFYRLKPSF